MSQKWQEWGASQDRMTFGTPQAQTQSQPQVREIEAAKCETCCGLVTDKESVLKHNFELWTKLFESEETFKANNALIMQLQEWLTSLEISNKEMEVRYQRSEIQKQAYEDKIKMYKKEMVNKDVWMDE